MHLSLNAADAEIIRTFGTAELLRHTSGDWELRGGTRTDRLEAREWISLFCHEAVLPRDQPGAAVVSRAARPCSRWRLPVRD